MPEKKEKLMRRTHQLYLRCINDYLDLEPQKSLIRLFLAPFFMGLTHYSIRIMEAQEGCKLAEEINNPQ